MKRRLVVLPEAEEEISAAAEWYESQKTGLGVELMAGLLTRFPYVIFYELVGRDRVDVVAVAHARRKPGYWLERKP